MKIFGSIGVTSFARDKFAPLESTPQTKLFKRCKFTMCKLTKRALVDTMRL